jgi:hypothetical protein
MDNAKYLELFKTHIAIVEQFGGSVTRDPVIVQGELEVLGINKDNATKAEILKARKVGEDKYLGMALIKGADRVRYNRLTDDIVNQFTMGQLSTKRDSGIQSTHQLPSHSTINSKNHKRFRKHVICNCGEREARFGNR